MADREHSVVREGMVAGFLGATSVALWFFVIDLIEGHLLYTPTTLGRALVSVLGPASMPDSVQAVMMAYTIVHYAVFFAIGILATWLVHRSETVPSLLAGFLILFVAFQLAFFGVIALLAEASMLGQLAWYQIGIANLIAFTLMGWYVYHRHPGLATRFAGVLAGRAE